MRTLYLIAAVIIILTIIYLINLPDSYDSETNLLSSICNGTLLDLKNNNPQEFMKLYKDVRNTERGLLYSTCKNGQDLIDCIELNNIYLNNMNCMAKYIEQSNLSEDEIMELPK